MNMYPKRPALVVLLLGLAALACATLSDSTPELRPTFPLIPNLSPTAIPEGRSRANPAAPRQLVTAFTVDVELVDHMRGQKAWDMLYTANRFNDPPPEGYEYVCVRLNVRNTLQGGMREINFYSFLLTGDQNVRYPAANVVEPPPGLVGKVAYQHQFSGWVCYLVVEDEQNLLVVVDISNLSASDGEFLSYIALVKGSAVPPYTPPDDQPISTLGLDAGDPAPLGEVVDSGGWSLRILRVLRGPDAWALLAEANSYNEPAPQGMEYILVMVEASFSGQEDDLGVIDSIAFKSIGALGTLYNAASVVEPAPALDHDLYPGGTASGWMAVLAGENEGGMILVYQPRFVYDAAFYRYLSLEP